MSRRTFSDYQASVVHALGAEPASGVSKSTIVNDAMKHLASMRSWNWLRGGEAFLDIRGPVSTTDATWTEGTLTLSSASFNGYVFTIGDTISITDGTDVTAGLYTIASHTTASNDIVLDETITDTAGDLATGDIEGSISFPYVNLPSDFGELVALTYPGSFARNMIQTTLEDVLHMRANPVSTVAFSFYYAVNSGIGPPSPQSAPDPLVGLSVPRLELYPAPSADVSNAIAVTYRRELKEMGSSTDVPLIPEWLDYPLDLLCRSFAMAMEDDNPNNSAQQMFDRLYPSLLRRDHSTQPRKGPMKGGLYPTYATVSPFYPDSIGDPS